ncbi:MAG: HAD-IIIA family hydrolase, partial [Ktedonobacterales bacterium]
MSDWTVGIKNDDDRKRITEALEEMYRLTQEPPEPPADQRTVLPVTHKQEFDLALAIFDLDGTLTQTRSGARFPQNLQDRTPMRHAQDRIAKLHDFGVKVAVATNQGGVAHGYYNDDELRATLREQMYAWFSIYHWNVAICSHHPGGTVLEYARECACRKPSP